MRKKWWRWWWVASRARSQDASPRQHRRGRHPAPCLIWHCRPAPLRSPTPPPSYHPPLPQAPGGGAGSLPPCTAPAPDRGRRAPHHVPLCLLCLLYMLYMLYILCVSVQQIHTHLASRVNCPGQGAWYWRSTLRSVRAAYVMPLPCGLQHAQPLVLVVHALTRACARQACLTFQACGKPTLLLACCVCIIYSMLPGRSGRSFARACPAFGPTCMHQAWARARARGPPTPLLACRACQLLAAARSPWTTARTSHWPLTGAGPSR